MASLKVLPTEAAHQQSERWSPYTDNGGTSMAIAGKDFVVIGADTRLSSGYSILSRDVPKAVKLTEKCMMVSSGMQADRFTLHKMLKARMQTYEFMHGQPMSTTAVAQLISTILYYRRFFPYYTFNVVAGIDEKGEGRVYGYDAIGSFECLPFCVTGSGTQLITPILDNQVTFKTHPSNKRDLSLDETLHLIKDAFTSAGERDIYTGDAVDLFIITKDGIREERFFLKKD
eukprot:TRINITY_DN4537_c0_g1_i1.p1 TRINITY_DN4537_c0_g1~~TRINITY_DN4537_c0_g1_i1.p1  ORF type:complete len:230 (+),score=34.41 TRINITY_DN4537_c0_g1_i1:55-744(+)